MAVLRRGSQNYSYWCRVVS